jgi:hypothetical protein
LGGGGGGCKDWEGGQHEWILTLRKQVPDKKKNFWWQETFDAVIVASGHYNVPWFPSIPGMVDFDEKFPGKILHSKGFRSRERFGGKVCLSCILFISTDTSFPVANATLKKVIVVGSSISAHEILHELLSDNVAHHPIYASLRGPPVAAFGYEPFDHPHIVIKPEIVRFHAVSGRIEFSDSTYLENVGHIIFATGYTFSLPFLPPKQNQIKEVYRRLPDVYVHTFDIEDPSLGFVGMVGGGFTFKAYEYQAVALARYFGGRAKGRLPTKAEQLAWERRRVAEKGGGKAYCSIMDDPEGFFEVLREFAGEPEDGTTGKVLPVFEKRWLTLWPEMVRPKLEEFRLRRRKAEEALQDEMKKKKKKKKSKGVVGFRTKL